MSAFSLDWLRLRAPVDRAARDPALASRFAQALRRPADRPVRLVDLGAGTGANARALAPVVGGDQDWLLAESDPVLLGFCAAEQIAWAAREGYGVEKEAGAVVIRAGAARWRFAARRVDLAGELAQCLAEPYDGLAFSALADLASAAWIDALAAQLERRRMPLLSSLMVDGRRQWHPPAAEDALVRDAFAAHQRRDKGLGPALAGAAPVYLGARLAAAGFAVATAASDWRIGPDQPAMLAAVLEAERRAAREERPEAAALIDLWAEQRRAALASASLSLAIGHRDLLARPREM
ncbi:MAG TPA: class I SAM-dependent methyltransferase [Stellaceae bacterium]|nr:class I SAM-dependent methyltransferase [Stellaceae bacterium]